MSRISSTYKDFAVEETIDRLFYRPMGYGVAVASRDLHLTPNSLTLLGIVSGVIAGFLLFSGTLSAIVSGILLLIVSETFDSADGQLARMTNSRSQLGRILDGVGGNLVFVSIYINGAIHVISGGGSPLIVLLVLAAGASHSFQCAMADFYRNAYLLFVLGRQRSELESSSAIAGAYAALSWKKDTGRKFIMRCYLNYTMQQEMLARQFRRLVHAACPNGEDNIPPDVGALYGEVNRPLLKYYNLITTNTRLIVLCVAALMDRFELYLWWEILVFNVVLVVVTMRQESLNRRLAEQCERAMVAGRATVC